MPYSKTNLEPRVFPARSAAAKPTYYYHFFVAPYHTLAAVPIFHEPFELQETRTTVMQVVYSYK